MRKYRVWAAAVLALASVTALAQDPALRKMTGESRAVVSELTRRIGGELRKEMESSGPLASVMTCQYSSPEVASELSRKTGWRVSRVSLKPRNPAAGTPDAWEQQVLAEFDRRAAAGEKADEFEHAEIVAEPSGRYFRYMKALPVTAFCLTCHGPAEKLPQSIKLRLAKEYPHDQATGYSVGQVRGAVTIKRPL